MRAACCEATVLRNEVIAPDIRLLTVVWPDRDHAPHAGQFFTLRSWGADEAPLLYRPISVHRWNPDSSTIEFLYQVVGEGTEKIAQLKMTDKFQLTGPMGNGFDVPDIVSKYQKIAVVGGGIGTAPMYQVTRELAAAGVRPDVFFGFRDAPYCMEEYRSIANLVKVSTDTGAVGFHGFVTQLYDPADYDAVSRLGFSEKLWQLVQSGSCTQGSRPLILSKGTSRAVMPDMSLAACGSPASCSALSSARE